MIVKYTKLAGTIRAKPYVSVVVKNPQSGNRACIFMLLDTGADMGVIPANLVKRLGLEQSESVFVRTSERSVRAKTYTASLSIMDDETLQPLHKAVVRVTTRDAPYGALGMDILGDLSMTFEAGSATIINKELGNND